MTVLLKCDVVALQGRSCVPGSKGKPQFFSREREIGQQVPDQPGGAQGRASQRRHEGRLELEQPGANARGIAMATCDVVVD